MSGTEETHIVADSSDDPEHVDDCPGCEGRPDMTMSPDVANVILRMAVTLEEEGRGPSSTSAVFTEGADEVDEDFVIRKAADVIGRDRIKDRDLLSLLAEIDERTAD